MKPGPATAWAEDADEDEAGAPGRVRAADARLVDGMAFALDAALDVPAVWGSGEEVLWSPGEPLLLVGPDGTGKTTLAQRLALARIGVGDTVLGYPVRDASTSVMYVAVDRPKQGGRSLRRMVLPLADEQMERVQRRLLVWKGPLPFDLVREPERLAPWVAGHGARDVFIDSLGIAVPGLAKDEAGAAVAQAFSKCSAEGIEVVGAYHPRKATNDNTKPNKLEDVYGSRWISASAGSVLSLWGQPGDAVVEFKHLKPPAEPVGPFMVVYDHQAGTADVDEGPLDLLTVLRRTPNGLTAQEALQYMQGGSDRAREVAARKRLDGYVTKRLAFPREGERLRGAVKAPRRYFATPPEGLETPPP